jgi:glycosyltransferase involved in cell wall biosynthesis
MSGLRVAVLTPQPLEPIHDGLNLRVFHLFRALAQVHEVSVLYLTEAEPAPPGPDVAAAGFARLQAVPIQAEHGGAFRHCRDFSPAARQAVEAFLVATPVDAVVAESIYMVPYAEPLIGRWPLLLDLVDDMSLLVRRSIPVTRDWANRLRRTRDWYLWRRYERRHLTRIPHIVVTSPEDARATARHAPRARIGVLPNGVDADVFRPLGASARAAEVVFTGVLGFGPNEAAVEHFYTRIFPRVRAAVPGARFTVAGKGPTERLCRLTAGDDRVVLTGFVADLRPFVGRAAVYVAPMVSGSGIKNKILEAWAMARPVVATPRACASLDGVPGRTHLVALSDEAFAAHVIRLLEDRDLGDAIGKEARRLVLERYRWPTRAAQLGAMLEEIAAAEGKGSPLCSASGS